MKNQVLIYLCITISMAGIKINAQAVCDNGGFESGYTVDYSFKSHTPGGTSFSCDVDTSTLNSFTPTGLNDFALGANATIVDNNITVSNGFDPLLHSLTPPINIPRVKTGNQAIKLNDYIARGSITTISKEFFLYEDFISYSYSLIMHSLNGATSQPYFIVRLYDASNLEIAEKCIIADSSSPHFSSVPYGSNPNAPLLYTGWQCDTISAGRAVYGSKVRLEFTITDANNSYEFGTVYIDDICNVPCPTCETCLYPSAPVMPSQYHQQEAEQCIEANNTILDGAMASYHAGYEVVLKEDFVATQGSTDRFYIEGCTGNFGLRESTQQEPEQPMTHTKPTSLQIYPNPTTSELNIIAGDVAVKAISLMTLDGKAISAHQQTIDVGTNYRLDLSSVSHGIYLLAVEKIDGTTTIQKIIKN